MTITAAHGDEYSEPNSSKVRRHRGDVTKRSVIRVKRDMQTNLELILLAPEQAHKDTHTHQVKMKKDAATSCLRMSWSQAARHRLCVLFKLQAISVSKDRRFCWEPTHCAFSIVRVMMHAIPKFETPNAKCLPSG